MDLAEIFLFHNALKKPWCPFLIGEIWEGCLFPGDSKKGGNSKEIVRFCKSLAREALEFPPNLRAILLTKWRISPQKCEVSTRGRVQGLQGSQSLPEALEEASLLA